MPIGAQLSPTSGFEFADINGDGFTEIISVGNLYNVEVETVRYDAAKGSIYSFKNGEFTTLKPKNTGFATSGDARDVKVIKQKNGSILLVTNNNGTVDVFAINKSNKTNLSS